jgi:hypothetical protein
MPLQHLFPVLSSKKICALNPVLINTQDEERLISFSNLLSGIPLLENIEIDLFHILCSRIGPQLFLQRSLLLKKILVGLESPNAIRIERNLYYISFLLTDWLQLIHKSGHDCSFKSLFSNPSLSPLAQPKRYHSFSNETFLSSFQTDYLPSHVTSCSDDDNESHGLLLQEELVDIGDACNIIFQSTVVRLRYDSEAFLIIKKLFPFLSFYLQVCPSTSDKDLENLCRYIVSYFSSILDQVQTPLSSYYVEGVELQIICLGFSLINSLARLLPVNLNFFNEFF